MGGDGPLLLVIGGRLGDRYGQRRLFLIGIARGMSVSPWAMAPALFVMGFGMGTCFGTLFDVALGDIRPSEAGSASGSRSAVQQLASAIGAAAITTVYFQTLAASGQAHAMTISLVVVLVVTVVCCGLVWLLPRAARADEGTMASTPAVEAAGSTFS